MFKQSITAAAIAVQLASAQGAIAQPAFTTAGAEADILFEQGRSLMDEGRLGEACAAFEASQKLSPAVSTLLNLAHCREQNKQLATAYGLFRDAELQTRAPLDATTQAMNRSASDRAKSLAPRLSKLTVSVPAANHVEGLVVSRGSIAIEPGAWSRALPIDGGKYLITARAPGYLEWSTTIEAATEGDARTVEVPALVRARVVGRNQRPWLVPAAVAGGATALLAGAAGIDALARSEYGEARGEIDDARQRALWEGAKTRRYLAQGVAVAGLAAAGVAVWLYLRGGRPRSEARSGALGALDVHPVAGADGGGLVLGGRF